MTLPLLTPEASAGAEQQYIEPKPFPSSSLSASSKAGKPCVKRKKPSLPKPRETAKTESSSQPVSTGSAFWGFITKTDRMAATIVTSRQIVRLLDWCALSEKGSPPQRCSATQTKHISIEKIPVIQFQLHNVQRGPVERSRFLST